MLSLSKDFNHDLEPGGFGPFGSVRIIIMTGDDKNPDSSANTGYIPRMLKRFNIQNAVPARTPLPHSLPLLKATKLDRRCNQLEYMEITGSLNHLAVYSRPDIAFAVSTLSQFNSDPTTTHLQANYSRIVNHASRIRVGAPNRTEPNRTSEPLFGSVRVRFVKGTRNVCSVRFGLVRTEVDSVRVRFV